MTAPTELEQTQLEIARLQLERERRRMRAEEAVGSAARNAAVGATRLAGGAALVVGRIALGAVLGFAVTCGLVFLLSLLTPFPQSFGLGERFGYLLAIHRDKILLATLCAAALYPVMRSRSSRRAQ